MIKYNSVHTRISMGVKCGSRYAKGLFHQLQQRRSSLGRVDRLATGGRRVLDRHPVARQYDSALGQFTSSLQAAETQNGTLNNHRLIVDCRVLNVDNSGSNGELCYTFSNNGTTSTGRHLLHVDNTGKIDGEQSEQSAC